MAFPVRVARERTEHLTGTMFVLAHAATKAGAHAEYDSCDHANYDSRQNGLRAFSFYVASFWFQN